MNTLANAALCTALALGIAAPAPGAVAGTPTATVSYLVDHNGSPVADQPFQIQWVSPTTGNRKVAGKALVAVAAVLWLRPDGVLVSVPHRAVSQGGILDEADLGTPLVPAAGAVLEPGSKHELVIRVAPDMEAWWSGVGPIRVHSTFRGHSYTTTYRASLAVCIDSLIPAGSSCADIPGAGTVRLVPSARPAGARSGRMRTMEFREVVRRRRMVRSFTDEPVPDAALDRMLEHAVRAPSAGFSQGWAFLRLDTPADVARFWRSTSPDPDADNAWLRGMRTAPAIVVPFAHRDAYVERYAEPDKGWTDKDEARWVAPYWYVDTGMASLLILQTAVDEGLGACFFGIPPTQVDAFRAEFGVPDDHAPLGAIAIGHPDGAAARGSVTRRTRRPLDDVVHRGHWSDRTS